MYIEVNAVGLACPKPVINTKKELDKIEEGIVVVTVDNDIAKQNILKLSNSLNCKAEIIKQ
ncbi:MAG: sulfurtransferase TusA family protein, partial [Romboutsia sp.]|nr:sulfurtransferase TusA family protein [Romboutsia sp.]